MTECSQRDSFVWFTQFQLEAVVRNGIVPEWFHGIISRKTAEELLQPKPPGYFLIRVSESRIGYTLSYRVVDRFRHFMIDVLVDGRYFIVGENRYHQSLQDLVDFHRRTPIMPYTEVLTVACGQSSNDKTDYAELLFTQRNPYLSLQQNDSRFPNMSQTNSEVDIPPALPHRPDNLRNSVILSSNRLYPSLEESFPHVSPHLPDPPVPKTRTRFMVDNHPVKQPPEVPARVSAPPVPNQNHSQARTVPTPECPPTQSTPDHTKASVATNLKNLRKKFQKMRSQSQEFMHIEGNMLERNGSMENEYQEITGEQAVRGRPLSYTPGVGGNSEELPLEYRSPPPFAPGY